jgi:DNA-binding XRE family transcriptional regulator
MAVKMLGRPRKPARPLRAVFMEFRDAVASAVRVNRGHQDIPQLEFAHEAGINQTTLSCLECGRGDPKLSTVVRTLYLLGFRLKIVPLKEP